MPRIFGEPKTEPPNKKRTAKTVNGGGLFDLILGLQTCLSGVGLLFSLSVWLSSNVVLLFYLGGMDHPLTHSSEQYFFVFFLEHLTNCHPHLHSIRCLFLGRNRRIGQKRNREGMKLDSVDQTTD